MYNNLNLGHAAFHPYQTFGLGFDRMFNQLDRLLQTSNSNNKGYPPFNVEKLQEKAYRITLAVAGFLERDIEITLQENMLVIVGSKKEDSSKKYLHHGIADRSFKREFIIDDRIEVNAATLKDGILVIDLTEIVTKEPKVTKIMLNR